MWRSMTVGLLMVGAGFFVFEAVLHAFGLPILQHDEIFLFTHDRYIALYAATMAAAMTLVASDLKKYRNLFVIVMLSIAFGIGNAMLIASLGGYDVVFPSAREVDGDLSMLGVGVAVWYVFTWISFIIKTTRRSVDGR
jgi:hypothetical protein